MKNLFAALLLLFVARSTIIAADAAAELASFSVFDKIDIAKLAKGDAKVMHGPPMSGRYLSVQSVYVAPGSPAQQTQALSQWDPTRHRELKVYLHGDLPSAPTPANFSKLKASDNSSIPKKLSNELQISKDEAKRFSENAAPAFWSDVLAERAKSFVSGGSAAQAPYDHSGDAIRASEELSGLLKQQDKIRKQFSGLLGATGIGRGPGSLTPELYWELLEADGQGVVTLGAMYTRAGGNGTQQAADVLYYASGGYYVSLTLYQMWPVDVDGKASTLVWRGDLLSSASLASLHGVERLGSESAMMKDVAKIISFFRRDTAR
ncbi:MAG: hypothetical protein ABJB69_06855 [Spartobacteria bacterium]